MFVVAGVSGNTGSVVAETLLAKGQKVRVVVRDAAKGLAWTEKGAEVAVADLDDAPALTRALEGARGAYLLVPPTPATPDLAAQQKKTVDALVSAAKTAKVPHVVLLSSVAAHLAAGTGPIRGLHVAEEELAKANVPFTAVRAAYFLENWASSLGALPNGVLPTFLAKDQAIPMVATADIGRVAAEALLEGPKGPVNVVELAGPVDLSPTDIARELTALVGKPITVSEGPLDALVPTLTGFGLGKSMAEAYLEMTAGVRSGVVTFEGKGTRLVRGTTTAREVLTRLTAR
ncbi:MAG: NmrA family NAD(P)-binding protein [Polyangiaceae bacterium]